MFESLSLVSTTSPQIEHKISISFLVFEKKYSETSVIRIGILYYTTIVTRSFTRTTGVNSIIGHRIASTYQQKY